MRRTAKNALILAKFKEVEKLVKEVKKLGGMITVDQERELVLLQFPDTWKSNQEQITNYLKSRKPQGNSAYEPDFETDVEFNHTISL